jgi:hypothetical protein
MIHLSSRKWSARVKQLAVVVGGSCPGTPGQCGGRFPPRNARNGGSNIACRRCAQCYTGRVNLCSNLQAIGPLSPAGHGQSRIIAVLCTMQ